MLVGVVAILLVGIDVIRRIDSLDLFEWQRWDTDADRSVIEVVGYAVTATAAVLLWRAGRARTLSPVVRAWAAVLVLVVADDAFEGHERGGELLEDRLGTGSVAGLRVQDVGELATWALLGVGCLLLIVLTHRATPRPGQRVSWTLAGAAFLLMVSAVGLDMLGVLVQSWSVPGGVIVLLALLEAAGELVAMGVFLAIALHLSRGTELPEGAISGASGGRR